MSAYRFIPFWPLEGFRGYRGPQMTGGREERKGRRGASAPQRVAWEASRSVSEVPGPDPPVASAGMGAPGSEGRPAATPHPDPRWLRRSWGRGRREVPETRPSEHAPASVSPQPGARLPHLPPPSSSGTSPRPSGSANAGAGPGSRRWRRPEGAAPQARPESAHSPWAGGAGAGSGARGLGRRRAPHRLQGRAAQRARSRADD